MNQETLNISQAARKFSNWQYNHYKTPVIENPKFKPIRIDLLKKADDIKKIVNGDKYKFDVELGLYIYSYFTQDWFTLRLAENDDFWRYLSVIVLPDLVALRWIKPNTKIQTEHFYSRGTRIWFKSLWWYVYLSWQGNEKDTREVLLNPNMSTDTIQNLVERSGRKGVYIKVYRLIMKYYSLISLDELKRIEKNLKKENNRDTFFRNIMKLNTAKMMTVEPGLFEDEEKGYVLSLFQELGVNFNEA